MATRIALAQPFALVLEALQRLLETAGLNVVGRCDSVEDLEGCLRRYAPDVALVDTLLARDGDVPAVIRAARCGLGGGRLVLLVPEVTPGLAREALALEIDGVLLMTARSDSVVAGLERIAAGDAVFPAGWLAAAHRAADPSSGLSERQPGVRRINDIDGFGESFADPHFEKSDHGQPEVFNANGDPYAYLHNSVTAPDGSGRGPLGLLTFTTQGDLPISWTVKASLAPERYTRDVELTDDELRAWQDSWQAYYDGTGPKPTLPLAPGTNAPAPDAGVVINLPPAPPAVTNNTTVVQSTAAVSNRCGSGRSISLVLSKKARKGSVRYLGSKGMRTVKARRSNGRLRATVDFREGSTEAGTYAAVSVREKTKSGWREHSRLFKLC